MSDEKHDLCSEFREHLLERDEQVPLSQAHAEHASGCEACADLYASMAEVDNELAGLLPVEAPPELVAHVLAQIVAPELAAATRTVTASAMDPVTEPASSDSRGIFREMFELVFGGFGRLFTTLFWPLTQLRRRPMLSSSLLVGGAAVCGLLVFGTLFVAREDKTRFSMATPTSGPEEVSEYEGENAETPAATPMEQSDDWANRDQAAASVGGREGDGRLSGQYAAQDTTTATNQPAPGDALDWGTITEDGEGRWRGEREGLDMAQRAQDTQPVNGAFQARVGTGAAAEVVEPATVELLDHDSDGIQDEEDVLAAPTPTSELPAMDAPAQDANESGRRRAIGGEVSRLSDTRRANRADEGERGAVERQLLEQDMVAPGHASVDPSVNLATTTSSITPIGNTRSSSVARAQAFLRERERVAGLSFQPATGHFSNNYVPGDPALRSLHQRLVEAGAATLGGTGATGLQLAEAARAFSQPFDAPRNAALALYVRGDQRATEGERRMLVEVGVRGAARRGGTRPAMNVGVVLDLSQPLDAGDQARVTALLEALSASRDVGDRISLSVAGNQGGELVEAGSFRHGQVQVAVDRLFHGAARSTPGRSLNLDQAVRASLASLAEQQDPTTPLGSSFVLVVTPGLASSPSLERAAHVGAVAGIPTSVVGVGDVAVGALDRLALAGQGRRRLLADASAAQELVRGEFDAISQVVARAIRLRIRLAPGTRLVSVLDSHSLDAEATARVREAEHSIDQRLAHSLGIQADRDEDDDGITIFIPAFYANDSHVILLDVVASGPGPVAEVSARYKDLLRLRNSEARSSLRIARGVRAPGPLERAVQKNLLAHELSRALNEAATLLRSGQREASRARLTEFVELSRGVRQLVPGLASDRELGADITLALRYDLALRTVSPPQTVALADSLQLASRRKFFLPMFSR